MTNEEVAVKLEDHAHEISALKHRMSGVEQSNQVLHRLATALEVMATKQESMSKSMDKLTDKVEALEAEPAKKWRFVVEKAIYFVVAAIVGFIMGKTGL